MSVIGFDIGNESCVIAVAKRGGVDVLLNDDGRRQTSAVVSFGDRQRFFGSAGAAFATANPKSTISHIKRLIGKLYEEVEEELKLLPFVTSADTDGRILIEIEYLKSKKIFTPVQILAMLFKHLKQRTAKNLESAVIDCVIGIPSYYTDLQRRLYLDAAEIAGLKPLRLMHDGTAIALGYGMYKTDLSYSGTINVMFVDIGHCDTQVTVAAFKQGKMKIMSHSFDQNLGGKDFDDVLFQHFATQFNERYKIDFTTNTRASIRLRASCEMVKKVLSANVEAPLSIECLIEDTDVSGTITRKQFETLSSKLLERVKVPCNRALTESGLDIDKISAIELVGSGSRIPAITKTLRSTFNKEPTRTLNASECVAIGCALQCAMLRQNFQVPYKFEDAFPYPILISSEKKGSMRFPKHIPLPYEKKREHRGYTPITLQVAYSNESDIPIVKSHIVGRFRIPSEPSNSERVKVMSKVKLDHNGIVEIDYAKITDKKTQPDSNDTFIFQTSKNLIVATANNKLVEAKEKEQELEEQDIKVEETKNQRNNLESYVYDTRSKLSGAYRSYATDSKNEIKEKLQDIENWLYENDDDDDDDDEVEQDYNGRLNELKKLLEDIEIEYFAKAEETLQTCIAYYNEHAETLQTNKKEEVRIACRDAQEWLKEVSQTHSSLEEFSSKINHCKTGFVSHCDNIINSESSVRRHKGSKDINPRVKTVEMGQHVDTSNGWITAKKNLETRIEVYRFLAENLPVKIKKEVNDDLIESEVKLSSLSQTRSTPNYLTTTIDSIINYLNSKWEYLMRSQSSHTNHEIPGDSDQPVGADKTDQAVNLKHVEQLIEDKKSYPTGNQVRHSMANSSQDLNKQPPSNTPCGSYATQLQWDRGGSQFVGASISSASPSCDSEHAAPTPFKQQMEAPGDEATSHTSHSADMD